jgi:hypothetical protein
VWTGGLSLRRPAVLVRELPGTSRLAVALRGGPAHDGWDIRTHLLAAAVDAINANTHAVIQLNSRKRIRPPATLPRPGTPAPAAARTVRLADLPGARPTAG